MMGFQLGQRAPEVKLKALDGRTYVFADEQPGWELLLFFKTECPTTLLVMPYVERIHEIYGDSPAFRVFSISQDPAAESAAFATQHGIRLPILLDDGWQASIAYDLTFVPGLFLIDEQGVIHQTHSGLNKTALNNMAVEIAEYLGRAAVKVAPADDGWPVFRPG